MHLAMVLTDVIAGAMALMMTSISRAMMAPDDHENQMTGNGVVRGTRPIQEMGRQMTGKIVTEATENETAIGLAILETLVEIGGMVGHGQEVQIAETGIGIPGTMISTAGVRGADGEMERETDWSRIAHTRHV